jgi:hypothetical protein
MCDHGSHFHGVPSGSPAHHVSVERIQYHFMRKLQRFVKGLTVSTFRYLDC